MIVFKYFLLLFCAAGIVACKSGKKPPLSGEEPVEVSDFIAFFPAVKLPYELADTSLLRKDSDSLLISHKVFTQFVPDSLLTPVFEKNNKPRIYPLGKVEVKSGETYLFSKAVSGNKRAAFILVFDKKDNFLAAMPLLQSGQQTAARQTVSIDRNLNISKILTRRNADGSISEGKDVFVLNSGGKNFMLIMTDPLDDKITELINPLDTFPRQQKFAADYGSGKMNLVSFRDGRKSNTLQFFIHFEKSNGECTGELKGEARMLSANQAEYREAGEPCSLRFTFTSSSVSVKEIDGCGSRRGLRCSFDGVYPRKKEVKPKVKKPARK